MMLIWSIISSCSQSFFGFSQAHPMFVHNVNLIIALNVNFRSCVRFVISDRSGMGKSLYINRLAENLKHNLPHSDHEILMSIPLHGPVITPDTLLELFKDHAKNPSCCIYHIDVAPDVSDFTASINFQCHFDHRYCGKWTLFYLAC